MTQQPRALAAPGNQDLELSTDSSQPAAHSLQLKGIQPSSSLHRYTQSDFILKKHYIYRQTHIQSEKKSNLKREVRSVVERLAENEGPPPHQKSLTLNSEFTDF